MFNAWLPQLVESQQAAGDGLGLPRPDLKVMKLMKSREFERMALARGTRSDLTPKKPLLPPAPCSPIGPDSQINFILARVRPG